VELVLEVGEPEPEPVIMVLCDDPDVVVVAEGVEEGIPPHAEVHVLDKLA
jgi:hypothetical protein